MCSKSLQTPLGVPCSFSSCCRSCSISASRLLRHSGPSSCTAARAHSHGRFYVLIMKFRSSHEKRQHRDVYWHAACRRLVHEACSELPQGSTCWALKSALRALRCLSTSFFAYRAPTACSAQRRLQLSSDLYTSRDHGQVAGPTDAEA